jgi:membrane-associated phospholipid phosphatase
MKLKFPGNQKLRLFFKSDYHIISFLIIILFIITSNISYSQSTDSLLLLKQTDSLLLKQTDSLFLLKKQTDSLFLLKQTDSLLLPRLSDSLLLLKKQTDSLLLLRRTDSLIRNLSPQMRDNYIDTMAKTDNFNIHFFRIINYNRSKFKDAILPPFTKSVFPMVLLMPINTFAYGRIYKKTYDENTGYLLAVAEITNFGFTYSAKFILKERRPYEVLLGVNKYTNLPLDPYAFPSAHTSFAFTTATTFVLRYPKYPQLYVPIYLWGFLVAYSRPYLGVHYPLDVLGGMVIATGTSILVYSLRSTLFKFKNHLFKENTSDDGSINGGVITIFAASILVSELLTTFVLPDSPLLVGIMPSSNDKPGINLTLNYGF